MAAIKPDIKLQPIRRCQNNGCLANGMCSYKLYDADISPALVSKVTDAVMELVVEWQNRPLDAIYPIVYLDCIVPKVRQDSRVINKSVLLALGINIDGQKELLLLSGNRYKQARQSNRCLRLHRSLLALQLNRFAWLY